MKTGQTQPIRKLHINTFTSEFNSITHRLTIDSIEDNFCPQDVIEKFWDKYVLFESRFLLYQMHLVATEGKDRLGNYLSDFERFGDFYKDVRELLLAVFLEHRYNKSKRKIVFVEEGEDAVV